MLGNLGGMMKQFKEMQRKAEEMQEKLAADRIETTAGGLVKVVVDGKGDLLELTIDGSQIGLEAEDTEMLQDALLAALIEAKAVAADRQQAMLGELTGGLPLPPGMDLGSLGG